MYINDAINLVVDTYFIQIETGVRIAILFEGPPGVGKSEAMEQALQRIQARLKQPALIKTFMLSTCEAPDVAGFKLPAKDTDGTPITITSRAPWAPRANDPTHGIIFLDEFRQSTHDVQKPAAELWLNGRVGETQLPITYMVVGASNREIDRSGVMRQLAFMENRYMRVQIEPHLDTWVDWAERKGIHPFAIAFAKRMPGDIFSGKVPEKPGPFATPRTLVTTSYLIGRLPINLFTEAAQGFLGEGTGGKFVAFLRVCQEVPEFEEIVAAPDRTSVPEKPDAQYATMQMIAHRVEPKTSEAAFRYLKRMGREFQVAGLKSTIRRCPEIMNSEEFIGWLRANKELVMSANLIDRNSR